MLSFTHRIVVTMCFFNALHEITVKCLDRNPCLCYDIHRGRRWSGVTSTSFVLQSTCFLSQPFQFIYHLFHAWRASAIKQVLFSQNNLRLKLSIWFSHHSFLWETSVPVIGVFLVFSHCTKCFENTVCCKQYVNFLWNRLTLVSLSCYNDFRAKRTVD